MKLLKFPANSILFDLFPFCSETNYVTKLFFVCVMQSLSEFQSNLRFCFKLWNDYPVQCNMIKNNIANLRSTMLSWC